MISSLESSSEENISKEEDRVLQLAEQRCGCGSVKSLSAANKVNKSSVSTLSVVVMMGGDRTGIS
jgi:hypothetical protein